MGTKHETPDSTVSDSKKRRKVGFTKTGNLSIFNFSLLITSNFTNFTFFCFYTDEGVKPNDCFKIYIGTVFICLICYFNWLILFYLFNLFVLGVSMWFSGFVRNMIVFMMTWIIIWLPRQLNSLFTWFYIGLY